MFIMCSHIHELEVTWTLKFFIPSDFYHLLPCSLDTSNVQIDRLNVHENVSHVPMSVPENIPPNITSDCNVNDDVDSSTTLPENPDSFALRRSGRPKKPIERQVAGSK